MSSPYLGEIRIFAGNFAPQGWAFCDGSLIPISENDALFQLIGTTYGGDGQETFGLPNLSSRVPVHMGTGSSGTTYVLGEQFGVESVTLTTQQLPQHTHPEIATTSVGTANSPNGALLAQTVVGTLYVEDVTDVNLAPAALVPVGGSQPHENRQPYLAINYIISLFGVFPSPS